jgi:hypothetical protein
MITNEEFTKSIKGLLLLILVIIANFLGTTINCESQHLIRTSPITRNIAVYLLIYFTIQLYSSPEIHPIKQFKNAFGIYVLYILLMKQNRYLFLFNSFLIIIIYINSEIKDYHIRRNEKEKIDSDRKYNTILVWILVVSLLLGFILHLIDMKANNNFNWIVFLFGNNKCSP